MASVLVVDDSSDVRRLVALVLERHPRFSVAGEAPDGGVAVTLARTVQPDVVLLDLSMPGIGGLEALPAIAAAAPSARIVVLSGFDTEDLAERALALGAAAYLEKDHLVERLVPTLEGLLP